MRSNFIIEKFKKYPLAWFSLLCWVGILSVLFMRNDALENLEIEESDLSGTLRLIEGNSLSSRDLEDQVDELEANVKEIEGRLFDKERRAINTDYLYSFEENHDIAIREVKLSEAEDDNHKKGGPHELKIKSAIIYNISLSARYENLMKYIYSLYRSDAFIRVKNLDITTGKDAGKEGVLQVSLRVLVLSGKN